MYRKKQRCQRICAFIILTLYILKAHFVLSLRAYSFPRLHVEPLLHRSLWCTIVVHPSNPLSTVTCSVWEFVIFVAGVSFVFLLMEMDSMIGDVFSQLFNDGKTKMFPICLYFWQGCQCDVEWLCYLCLVMMGEFLVERLRSSPVKVVKSVLFIKFVGNLAGWMLPLPICCSYQALSNESELDS